MLQGHEGSEGTLQAAARQEQEVTTTRSASTKVFAQHGVTTPFLLKLPPEIRTQIFRLIVGDQLIHLLYTDLRVGLKPGFRHCLCTAAQSEDEAYEEFSNGYSTIPSGQDPQYYVPPFKQRHARCKHWDREEGRFFSDAERLQWWNTPQAGRLCNRMSLSVLGLCRQIHEEASFLLWTTNTFSFEDPLTLDTFMNRRNSVQRAQLTAIHIDTQWEKEVLDAWAKLMTPSFLTKFSGLQTLHATYDQGFVTENRMHGPMASLSRLNRYLDPSLAPIQRMRILPLKHVTVLIADDVGVGLISMTAAGSDKIRWTVAQKREVADLLRRKLLEFGDHKLDWYQLQAETTGSGSLLETPVVDQGEPHIGAVDVTEEPNIGR